MTNWQNVLDAIDEPFPELTADDKRIARMIARGKPVADIADFLDMNRHTLNTRIKKRVCHRTGCKTLAEIRQRYWRDVDKAINLAVYGKRRIQ